eukprot:1153195-Pelagomonas_calceolata.AAC.2
MGMKFASKFIGMSVVQDHLNKLVKGVLEICHVAAVAPPNMSQALGLHNEVCLTRVAVLDLQWVACLLRTGTKESDSRISAPLVLWVGRACRKESLIFLQAYLFSSIFLQARSPCNSDTKLAEAGIMQHAVCKFLGGQGEVDHEGEIV